MVWCCIRCMCNAAQSSSAPASAIWEDAFLLQVFIYVLKQSQRLPGSACSYPGQEQEVFWDGVGIPCYTSAVGIAQMLYRDACVVDVCCGSK